MATIINQITNGDVTKATIDDIYYNNITRKIITSKDIYKDILPIENRFNLDNKINAIDIDWNGATTSLGEIHNTSDLIKQLNKIIEKYSVINNIPFDIYSNYIYYFEDNNGKLSNYLPFTASVNFTKDNIAPKHATKIGVYNNADSRIGYVSLENNVFSLKHIHIDDTPSYTVGLLSDIHYGDTCDNEEHIQGSTDNGNDKHPYEDLENALQIFTKIDNLDFICSPGDISTDNTRHLETFRQSLNKNAPHIPFFTCKGNHDNTPGYSDGNNTWLNTTLPHDNQYYSVFKPIMFESGDQTSFYFMKGTDMYIFFNVDYSRTGTSAKNYHDTILTGLNINNEQLQYYNEDTIAELQSLLERNKNNRTFIFTHQFLPNKAGSPWNDYQTYNTHNINYYLSGIQFGLLNQMNNHYKNSIWFSGHSHYKWNIQTLSNSDRANVCNWDYLNNNYDYTNNKTFSTAYTNQQQEKYSDEYIKSAYNVHIPSLARPLRLAKLTGVGYDIEDPGAEGAVMDVYDDGVRLRGITFCDINSKLKDNLVNKLLDTEDATLVIDVSKTGKDLEGQRAYVDEEGYINVRFTKPSQRVYITNFTTNAYAVINDVIITDDNGNNLTEEYLNVENPKVGLYTGINPIDYSLKNCHCKYTKTGKANESDTSNSLGGLEIPCSSQYLTVFNTLPINLRFKGSWYAHNNQIVNYENNYVPEANYWINVPCENPEPITEKKTIQDFYQEVINIKNNYRA